MENFITIIEYNYSWNQISKIRNDLERLNKIYYHEKCNDKTKQIIDFYRRNNEKFNRLKNDTEQNQNIRPHFQPEKIYL